MINKELRQKTVAVRHVGNILRVGDKTVAFGSDLLAGFFQLVHIAAANEGGGTGLGELVRSRHANAR